MDRFQGTANSDVILRLMWAMNEISQIAHLSRMIDKSEEHMKYCWKYFEGLRGSLIRQRASIANEILDTVVRPLVADDADFKYPTIYKLIRSNRKLGQTRGRLRTLFYGKYKIKFETHRQIRHRITGHFDHKLNFQVLPDALKQTTSDWSCTSGEPFVGYIMQGLSPQNKAMMRFIFVDEVLSTAWRKNILGIEFSKSGYQRNRKVLQTEKFMLYYMSLFHDFSLLLIEDYLTINCLWTKEFDPGDLFNKSDSSV